ncbi:MAG: flagellar biosynthesis protein FlgL [Pseudorhodoplanes sp.]
MTVSSITPRLNPMIASLVDMRARLDDLQAQLGTGKKATDYAGFGLDRSLAVGLRAQLSSLSSFDNTIATVGVRLTLAQTALGQIDDSRRTMQQTMMKSVYTIDGTGQTTDQKAAAQQLDIILGALNTRAGDRYLFSGAAVDQPSVETADHILNGDGARAGLKQVIDERRQADLGASGLGRVVVGSPSASAVSITEDAAGSPFGFKVASVVSTFSGATVSGPTGSPPGVAVDLGATNPTAGQSVTFTFNLPDGSQENLTLTATDANPPGPNQFTIGADAAASAGNLQAALTTSLGKLAGSSLAAASAMAAGNDFFNTDAAHPPQRVNGPPFDTATSLIDGTPANTVSWYTGEAGSAPARGTVTARVDTSISVSYGMRASEESLRAAVQNIAVFAATSYSASDPNAGGSYDALKVRTGAALTDAPGHQKITDIEAEIAGAQTSLSAAKERHTQTNATLSDMVSQIEGVPPEQVAAQILSLQTSLQASLQTTAMLYKTSILNYL